MRGILDMIERTGQGISWWSGHQNVRTPGSSLREAHKKNFGGQRWPSLKHQVVLGSDADHRTHRRQQLRLRERAKTDDSAWI